MAVEDDVFAAYGRAMHKGQALEFWLRVVVATKRTATNEFETQDQVEVAVATLSVSTLGTVFTALRKLQRDDVLERQLTEAVSERNRLAHHFFAQWDDRWTGVATNVQMIADLERITSLFADTIDRLVPLISGNLDIIGSDPDSFVAGLADRILARRITDGFMSE